MGYSLYGAAGGFLLIAALALGGCAESPGTAELQASDTGAGQRTGTAGVSSEGESVLRLASDVEARGSPATALPLYQRAASLPNADASTHVKLGDIYARLGRDDQAAAAYRDALAKEPENGLALLGLGGVQVRAGRAADGVTLLAKAAPLVNSATAYDRLGVAHMAMGQPREALASFEQAHSIDSSDLDIATNLALAAALSGQKDRAEALAQATLASKGVQDYHRRNLILAMGISGREEDARRAGAKQFPAAELDALMKQAREIRQIASPNARALALGTMRSETTATN